MRSTSPHPYEYPPQELSDSLLHQLRRPHLPGCAHAAHAAATAGGGFLSPAELADELAAAAQDEGGAAAADGAQRGLRGVCRQLERRRAAHAAQHRLLGPECRLLARKFLPATVEAALAAMAPCDSSARILNDGLCLGETPAQAARRLRWQRAAPAVLLALAWLLLPLAAALALGGLVAPPQAAGGRCSGAR